MSVPATPDLSSIFSLNNLRDYSQLIDCVAKIKDAFIDCNDEAQRKGEKVLKYVDEKTELARLLKCCGVWLVRDCWVKAAEGQCTREQVDQLYNMPSKMMPGLDGVCQKYPAGSTSCYTPHIVFGAVVFSALLLLIILIIVAIFIARHISHRRQGSSKLESGIIDEERHRDSRSAEKVKLTGDRAETNSPANNNNLEYIDSEKAN